jgi:hypothetical protein
MNVRGSNEGVDRPLMRLATWNLERSPPSSTARLQRLQAHMSAVDADI